MNKERWVVAGVAVVAVSIWGFLLFTIFSTPDEPEMADDPVGENGNGLADMYEDALGEEETFPSSGDELPEGTDSDTGDQEDARDDEDAPAGDAVPEEEVTVGEPGEPDERGTSMRTRGIHPGDFQDIAPDGIASIDDVLERLDEDE